MFSSPSIRWSFKQVLSISLSASIIVVTAASSELDKVGTTFLQLKLKVVNSKGELESLNMGEF